MNTMYLPFKAEIIRKGRLKLLGVWTLQQFVLIKGGLVGPAKSYALLYRSLECDKKQHGLVSMIKHWIMKHRDGIFHLNIPLRIRNEWKRRTGGVQRTDWKCTNCWGTCCWQFREVYEARRPTFRQRWWCEKCVTQIYQCVLIHHARFEVSRTEDECS